LIDLFGAGGLFEAVGLEVVGDDLEGVDMLVEIGGQLPEVGGVGLAFDAEVLEVVGKKGVDLGSGVLEFIDEGLAFAGVFREFGGASLGGGLAIALFAGEFGDSGLGLELGLFALFRAAFAHEVDAGLEIVGGEGEGAEDGDCEEGGEDAVAGGGLGEDGSELVPFHEIS